MFSMILTIVDNIPDHPSERVEFLRSCFCGCCWTTDVQDLKHFIFEFIFVFDCKSFVLCRTFHVLFVLYCHSKLTEVLKVLSLGHLPLSSPWTKPLFLFWPVYFVFFLSPFWYLYRCSCKFKFYVLMIWKLVDLDFFQVQLQHRDDD